MTEKRVCVECRWCELSVDLEKGSCYVCRKTDEPQLQGAVIHKPACRRFEAPPPSPYWGP